MAVNIPYQIKRHIVGQYVATGATPVTVTVPNLQADSVIIISMNTPAGTPAAPFVVTKDVAGGEITLASGSSDTSTYDVVVME